MHPLPYLPQVGFSPFYNKEHRMNRLQEMEKKQVSSKTSDDIVTIKFLVTDSEIVLLINSLTMTTTTLIPTEDNGKWKNPYEKLLKDLKKIKANVLEFKEKRKNSEKVKVTGTQNPAECETCD
jgi:hypothetical protein